MPAKFQGKRRADGLGPANVRFLRKALLAWYGHAKRDLPWRRTRDPYAIWLSEVMLQQTRVQTVIPYFERFLARWPTVASLAEAPIDDVLSAWSGLGYYRRARMLHAGARAITESDGFPPDAESLGKVPGIGRYTAGAVASIAYGEAAPLVDGNVARVLARLFAVEDDVRAAGGVAKLWSLASSLVDPQDPGSWNQALMELGATVCTPREPRCASCPVREACRAYASGRQEELPRAKAKAKPKLQRRWALVALRSDQVLLGQRRLEARFGGLWEPPMLDVASAAETETEAGARLAALVGEAGAGVRARDVVFAANVTHVLSHRRLEVRVLRARSNADGPVAAARAAKDGGEYASFAFVDLPRALERGVSTLARKVLAAAIG